MDGRPKAVYDPYLVPTMPPIGGSVATNPSALLTTDGGVDPKSFASAMMVRDSSLPSINSLMRVPATNTPSAVIGGGYNSHLVAQPPLGMYHHQPYPTHPAATGLGYPGLPVPNPPSALAPTGTSAAAVASPLQPTASESPQIYDLDKNFHLNAPVPQYPPAGVTGAEIPPPGYGAPYHQRPPGYGNFHPTSSYNYNDDYYGMASSFNSYGEYATPMGFHQPVQAAPGLSTDPSLLAGGGVLQPLGQQVTQLQPVGMGQQPIPSGVPMATPLPSTPAETSSSTGSKKSGSTSGSGSSGEKKTEKKPTMSSMARYVCNHCDGKEFVSLPVISKHIRQHNLHLCNLCVRVSGLMNGDGF